MKAQLSHFITNWKCLFVSVGNLKKGYDVSLVSCDRNGFDAAQETASIHTRFTLAENPS